MAPCDAHELIAKLTEENKALRELLNEQLDGRHIDRFKIERLQRAVDWALTNFAGRCFDGAILRGTPMNRTHELKVPAEFADIISPAAAVGQDGRQ